MQQDQSKCCHLLLFISLYYLQEVGFFTLRYREKMGKSDRKNKCFCFKVLIIKMHSQEIVKFSLELFTAFNLEVEVN